MSGVMGASLRSSVGSPAWTAIVSACGIASAYLTPLVATQLEPIAQPLQNRKSFVELRVVAGEERPFASGPRGIRQRADRLKDGEGAGQHVAVAANHAESAPSLGLQRTKRALLRHLQESVQPIRGGGLPGVDQEVKT